jgi:hypothetical protein
MTLHVLMIVAAISSRMRGETALTSVTPAQLRRKQQNRNAYATSILLKEPCAFLTALLAKRHSEDVRRHEFAS